MSFDYPKAFLLKVASGSIDWLDGKTCRAQFLDSYMNNPKQLNTLRLTMIAATLEHIRVELESPEQLSVLLDAEVSSDWPTGEYDRDAMEFFRAQLEEGGKEAEGWYGWYAVRTADAKNPRTLVG